MPDEIEMPWKPRSRSQQGLQTERHIVEKRGGRVHPRSGAGRIKDDGSTESEVMEVKDAAKSHTIKGEALDVLFRRATQQGKDAVYIVYFRDADITATMTLTRGKG